MDDETTTTKRKAAKQEEAAAGNGGRKEEEENKEKINRDDFQRRGAEEEEEGNTPMVSVLRYSNTGSRKLGRGNEVQPKEVRVAIEFSQRKTLKHAARINIRSTSVNRIIKEGGAGETQRGGADDVMQLEI